MMDRRKRKQERKRKSIQVSGEILLFSMGFRSDPQTGLRNTVPAVWRSFHCHCPCSEDKQRVLLSTELSILHEHHFLKQTELLLKFVFLLYETSYKMLLEQRQTFMWSITRNLLCSNFFMNDFSSVTKCSVLFYVALAGVLFLQIP